MQVSDSDHAEVPHSYMRKRRVPTEIILIVRNYTPLAADFSFLSVRNTAPYTAECTWYAADQCAHNKLLKCAPYAAEKAQDKLWTGFQFPILNMPWPYMLTVRLSIWQ